jgi:hypothetical protein
MKTLLTSALIAATLSGAAFAASAVPGINPGDVQLALSAGVEPGAYSRSELLNILEAKRNNEDAGYFLSGANRTSASGNANAGAAQLALTAGVEPGAYSVPELLQIIEAKRDGDTDRLNFVLSGASRSTANPAETVTPGEATLAAVIGVNPADYTLAELIALQPQSDD